MRTGTDMRSAWLHARDRWPRPPDEFPPAPPVEVPGAPEIVPGPVPELPVPPIEVPRPAPGEVPEPGDRARERGRDDTWISRFRPST
jgi:hypothetical protein